MHLAVGSVAGLPAASVEEAASHAFAQRRLGIALDSRNLLRILLIEGRRSLFLGRVYVVPGLVACLEKAQAEPP